MKLLKKIALWKSLVATISLIFVAGCVTSLNPFYQETDIVRDSRFVGTFVSDDAGLKVAISYDERSTNHYKVELTEGGKASDYLAVLFKLKDSLFVDLIPINEKKVIEQYSEGYPTASGLLRHMSHDGKVRSSTRLHVLFRLSLTDNGIQCYGGKKADDPSNPLIKYVDPRCHTNADSVVIEANTEKLRSIVERYSGTNWAQLFQDNGLTLIRR